MKFIVLICLCASTQLVYCQIFKIETADKMLTTGMSVNEAKKILRGSYDFTGDGGMSTAGNIAYNFETRDENH